MAVIVKVLVSSAKTSSNCHTPATASYTPLVAELLTYWNPVAGPTRSFTAILVTIIWLRLVSVTVNTTSLPTNTLSVSTVFSRARSIWHAAEMDGIQGLVFAGSN